MIEKELLDNKNAIISATYTSICFVLISYILNNFFNNLDKTSFIIGIFCSVCNFYVILWAWSRIFLKKRIALAISVIVSKYALIGIIIYYIISIEHYNIISFLCGLFSLFIMIIWYSLLQNKTVS